MGLRQVYITNVVTCRSCAQAYDTEGNPRYRKDRNTGELALVIQDQPPTPAQMTECLPRLYEEIYLVDPVLIVALGVEAAKALSRSAISILAETGTTKEITIPGAGYHPLLTAKKAVWVRKVRGEIVMPGEQNQVRYLMMPLLHPAYLVRRFKDERYGNPLQLFAEGMKKAVRIYDRYMFEVYGNHPAARELSEEDVQHAIEGDE
jgi:uracil-DNA glycosylase